MTGKASAAKKQWVKVGDNLECDGNNGEEYLESPGKFPTLAACKASCESSAKCKSISYFKSGFCSHWDTGCKSKKYNKNTVVSFRFTSDVPAKPVGS